jgi:hypothetical protein
MMRKLLPVGALALLVLAGCRALALIASGQDTKTVPAEYPYLDGKQVAIVVHAPDETIFEHPNVQWEVADHVRVGLESNIKGIKVADTKRIFDFQRAERDWEKLDPAALGLRFGADRVLEIDLTQYETREPESPHLFRGHMTADVRIYNTEYPDSQHTYRAGIQTEYPPDGPGQYGTTDREVRRATMEAFAQDVAGKFYDRKVKAD